MQPSRVARKIAGDLWPDVQIQRRLVPGIYGFTCAGHGGIVAVLDAAKLSEHEVECARETNKIELVAAHEWSRGGQLLSTVKYTPDSLREWVLHPNRTLYECWIGEEDCDWATVMYALDDHQFAKAIAAGYTNPDVTREDVIASLESWNPEFLARCRCETHYLSSRTDYDADRDADGRYPTRYEVWAVGGTTRPSFWSHDEERARANLRDQLTPVPA